MPLKSTLGPAAPSPTLSAQPGGAAAAAGAQMPPSEGAAPGPRNALAPPARTASGTAVGSASSEFAPEVERQLQVIENTFGRREALAGAAKMLAQHEGVLLKVTQNPALESIAAELAAAMGRKYFGSECLIGVRFGRLAGVAVTREREKGKTSDRVSAGRIDPEDGALEDVFAHPFTPAQVAAGVRRILRGDLETRLDPRVARSLEHLEESEQAQTCVVWPVDPGVGKPPRAG